MRLRLPLVLATLVLCVGSGCAQSAPEPRAGIVFLVRHAERAEDGTDDPHISEAGRARADLLGRMLADAGIDHIYSTDYFRTRETVAPLQNRLGLELEIYDGSELEAFARKLLLVPGRHLVVGHSNTTPALVEALGGDPGSPIQTMEYDRLYVLTPGSIGTATLLLRFGAPFGG